MKRGEARVPWIRHSDGCQQQRRTGSHLEVDGTLTFTRTTANPLSTLKKVTRSTSPAISSEAVRGWGESFIRSKSMRIGPHQRGVLDVWTTE